MTGIVGAIVCVRCGGRRLMAALLWSGPICHDCNGSKP